MLFSETMFTCSRIRSHAQFIITQLVYGLRQIRAIDCEVLRENSELDWIMSTLKILTYYLNFDTDSARFILQRIRILI